jgi:SAM-dependent methyltransferase
MVTESVKLLEESQMLGINPTALDTALHKIHSEIFVQGDRVGFLKKYQEYKINKRPLQDYKEIYSHIMGRKVLDFGAGNSYFSKELKKNGYDVTACDVLDYHGKDSSGVPFFIMSSPTDLSFLETKYDTIFLKTVLHHISEENVIVLLNKLRSKTNRLIVEEDVYGISKSNNYCINNEDSGSRAYCELTEEEQVQYLTLMDFFGNIVVYRISEMNMPYNFKTIDQWQNILRSCSWSLRQSIVLGFDKSRIHRPFQAWFICD